MANAPGRSATAIAGYKRTRELFATNARKGVLLSQEIFPGLNGTQTDEEILSVVKASGRCRMVQGHVGWGKSGMPWR